MSDQNNDQLRQVQRAATTVLAEFDRVCQELGLRYCAYGGTAIGAVRHGGFIPWDDDVDVCMPREDYEHLVREHQRVLDPRFVFLCQETDPQFPKTFGLLGIRGTSFRPSNARQRTYSVPIGVDIFPLDRVPRDRRTYARQSRATWIWGRLLFVRGGAVPITSLPPIADAAARHLAHAAHTAVLPLSTRAIYDHWKRAAIAGNTQSAATRLADYSTQNPLQWAADEWELFPTTRVPFENIEVDIPRDVHAVLTRGYGDYMSLPPENQRVNHSATVDFGEFCCGSL